MRFLLFVLLFLFFFFNDTATTEIYTLSLHDALPISSRCTLLLVVTDCWPVNLTSKRSEEHTSELQSRRDLVCRLLLEKQKRTRVNSSPVRNSYAVFCLQKKK